ncbi:MAG: NAD-dependent epimerase/dehydratase family protein [Nitrososphaerales archaeon]
MNWRGLRVLVTGGAGFIGGNLVKRLVQYGADVTVLDDLSSGNKKTIMDIPCKFILGNVLDIDELLDVNPTIIFHFAAPSSDVLFRKDPIGMMKNCIIGMIRVCEFCKRRNVRKLVYASSSSVYGNTSPPHREDSPTRPTNLYGLSKLICEEIAKSYTEVSNVGLRIFAGYGPGEERKGDIASVVSLFLFDLLRGQRPILYGDGSQKRDFVYIDDIIEACIKVIEYDVEGVLNVGSGESTSFIDLLRIMYDELGVHIQPVFKPKPPGYFDNTLADITLLSKYLQRQPFRLRAGIRRFIDYARSMDCSA